MFLVSGHKQPELHFPGRSGQQHVAVVTGSSMGPCGIATELWRHWIALPKIQFAGVSNCTSKSSGEALHVSCSEPVSCCVLDGRCLRYGSKLRKTIWRHAHCTRGRCICSLAVCSTGLICFVSR